MDLLKEKLLKKGLVWSLGIATLVVSLAGWFGQELKKAPLGGFSSQSCATASATTTLTTLNPIWGGQSGTTTLECAIGSADQLNLQLFTAASSTNITYVFTIEYSDNGMDWYGEDRSTAISNTVLNHHGTTTVAHIWSPGTMSTTSKSVWFTDVFASYARLRISTVNSTSTVHVRLIKKNIDR